jgi:hypothetical protein
MVMDETIQEIYNELINMSSKEFQELLRQQRKKIDAGDGHWSTYVLEENGFFDQFDNKEIEDGQ